MKRINIHIPYRRLTESLNLVKDRRLDLEIYFDSNTLDYTKPEDYETIKKELNYNPRFTFHAPFIDMSPGSVDKLIRDVTIKRFNQLFKIADIFRPEVIVFHPGYDKWRYNGYSDAWLENSIKTWRGVLAEAEKLNIKVAVENIFEEDPKTLSLLVKQINSPNLGLCFDTGHFNLFSKATLEKWFEDIGNNILEVHIHDNSGKSDEHLGIGDGNIDFDRFFSLLKSSGSEPILTIEGHSKEAVEKSLVTIQKYL